MYNVLESHIYIIATFRDFPLFNGEDVQPPPLSKCYNEGSKKVTTYLLWGVLN